MIPIETHNFQLLLCDHWKNNEPNHVRMMKAK